MGIAISAQGAREAKPSPLLDTQGTNRQTSETTYLSLLATGDATRERRRVAAALRDIPRESSFWAKRAQLERRANRLEDCGRYLTTYATTKGSVKLAPNSCDDALCNRCSYHRTRKIRERFQIACGIERTANRRIRMITLTQKVIQGESWQESHARLMKQWRGFWRDKETRKKIKGCLRRIETTWSWKHKGWHVHCHVAYSGSFWRTQDLCDTWCRHGAGRIVDAREVYRDAELFKYLLKTSKASKGSIVEYAIQSSGRRLLDLLGDWRKIKLPDDPQENGDQSFEVDMSTIRRAAEDPGAAKWILAGYLSHFEDPDPRTLARWARRVLACHAHEMDRLIEREARRHHKEHKRRIQRVATNRARELRSRNEDH